MSVFTPNKERSLGIGRFRRPGVRVGGSQAIAPLGRAGNTGPVGPTAPVLGMDASWDSSQASPIFDIDAAFVAGDDLQFEYETSGANWASPTVVHHTVTSGELSGNQISLGIGALANGNWEARCKFAHVSPPTYSSYSNVQAFTIAAAATNVPTFYILGF